MTDVGFGTLLEAAANCRGLRAGSPHPTGEDEVRRVIADAAQDHGLDPVKVLAAFERSGPLGDLVRGYLGGRLRTRKPRGAPIKQDTFDSFVRVKSLVAAGHSERQAVKLHAAEMNISEAAVRKRINASNVRLAQMLIDHPTIASFYGFET